MEFPIEILEMIFNYLYAEDLIECQLVCKAWYTPATKKLFANIHLLQPHSVISFLNFMKSSPGFGLLIKSIQVKCNKDVWRDNKLLEFIIKHCPNLELLTSLQYEQDFWDRLSLAGQRKKLKLRYIQSLLRVKTAEAIKHYNRAALAFKETLVSLEICNRISRFHPRLYQQEFLELAQRLHEFKALKVLTIFLQSDQGIIAIDKIISRCAHLKHISAFVDSTSISTDIFCRETVQPHPGVKFYHGQNSILDDHNSLLYFMHKFPNLEWLKLTSNVLLPREVLNPVPHRESLIAFLDYISKIPSVVVEINSKGISLDVIYEAVIHKITNTKKLDIKYQQHCKELSLKENGIELRFAPHECLDSMKYVPYIKKFGYLLESVSVTGIVEVQEVLKALPNEGVTNKDVYGNWLIHILNYCPNLKQLQIDAGGTLDMSCILLQRHSTLKKLIVHGIEDVSLLAKLTVKTPSVTHVNVVVARNRKTLTTLDMPTASLDTLGWLDCTLGFQPRINFSIEITTTSNNEHYYFIADEERAIRYTTEYDYQQALLNTEVNFKLNIKCKSSGSFDTKWRAQIARTYRFNLGTENTFE